MDSKHEDKVTDIQKLGAKLMSEAMRESDVDVVMTALVITLASVVNIVEGDHRSALRALEVALEHTQGKMNGIFNKVTEH